MKGDLSCAAIDCNRLPVAFTHSALVHTITGVASLSDVYSLEIRGTPIRLHRFGAAESRQVCTLPCGPQWRSGSQVSWPCETVQKLGRSAMWTAAIVRSLPVLTRGKNRVVLFELEKAVATARKDVSERQRWSTIDEWLR